MQVQLLRCGPIETAATAVIITSGVFFTSVVPFSVKFSPSLPSSFSLSL